MQATRKLGAEHVVYLKQNVNGMAIIASFCDKSIPKIRISNETWVIVGSVAEPTITKFHLSWGEDGYAVSKHTPTRHLKALHGSMAQRYLDTGPGYLRLLAAPHAVFESSGSTRHPTRHLHMRSK